MRFYPTADIYHYWEFPSSWSHYCHEPHKSWHRRPLQAKHAIAHWRDLQGARLPLIRQKDLYFKNWPVSRVRPEACLPMYYAVGNRFIRLQKEFPVGFKCGGMPLNLQEVRDLRKFLKKKTQAEDKEASN